MRVCVSVENDNRAFTAHFHSDRSASVAFFLFLDAGVLLLCKHVWSPLILSLTVELLQTKGITQDGYQWTTP
jgi:hypothetical protein